MSIHHMDFGMKIAVGVMSHETNTFASGATGIESFSTATGADLRNTDNVGRSLDGIVETLEIANVEILPTVGASALPAPTVKRAAFEWIKQQFLNHLDETVDGICLDLHGSMYVKGEPDPEGKLLAAIREKVGPHIPITAALDMHATITEQMVSHLDGVAGYRTAPHTDVEETGVRAAELLLTTMQGDASLTLGWKSFPMLLAGEQSESGSEPMRTLLKLLYNADETDGIYDANYFLGFPWADSPHAGCHALITGEESAATVVNETASDLAGAFWRRRDEFKFTTEAYEPTAALDEAAETGTRPTIVADTGDIPGAGASEKTTNLLATIIDRTDLGTPVLAVIVDAASYTTCRATAKDIDVSLSLGRTYPKGTPLDVTGTVVDHLETDDVGTALVSLDGGVDVIIANRRTNVHRDPAFLRHLGISPSTRQVIALKSGYLSPEWKDVAARRLFALTYGETNQRLTELPYERVPRPIYPLDEETTWSP